MPRTSKTILNNSGESVHLCLITDFRGNAFSFSPLKMIFAADLSYMTFIILCAHFLDFFFLNHEWVLNFVKSFSASTEMIIWFFKQIHLKKRFTLCFW